MSKAHQLIPSVAYVRKSTRGEVRGKQRQEKSLAQQRTEIAKLAAGQYEVLKIFEDEGISGWKRGAKRPDFQRMIAEVQGLGAQAIICDNLDRFSRATVNEVQIDANELRQAGVRWIVTASHGTYVLGNQHDIGEILKFVVAIWSANEYSRQLSRRISLARRNKALEGKRTGGSAGYALVNDGHGSVKHGDARQVKTVRRIFEEFTSNRSMNQIADALNREGVAAPHGKWWHRATIREILTREAYRGDFVWNKTTKGQFYRLDEKGEVVETAEAKSKGRVFTTHAAYKPIVSREVFDKAQKRLQVLRVTRKERNRGGYALSGILLCGHCGLSMYGSKPNKIFDKKKGVWKPGRHIVYTCSSVAQRGRSACSAYQIRESIILPYVMKILGEEIEEIKSMITTPPAKLTKRRLEHRKEVETDREKLAKRIKVAVENIMGVQDKRTRQEMDERLTEMRDELQRLDAELAVGSVGNSGYSAAEVEALEKFWDSFHDRAVEMPVSDKHLRGLSHAEQLILGTTMHLGAGEDPRSWGPDAYERTARLDPSVVNERLRQLGMEVKLFWRTEKWISKKAGKEHNHYVLERGRLRCGQRENTIMFDNLTKKDGTPAIPCC